MNPLTKRIPGIPQALHTRRVRFPLRFPLRFPVLPALAVLSLAAGSAAAEEAPAAPPTTQATAQPFQVFLQTDPGIDLSKCAFASNVNLVRTVPGAYLGVSVGSPDEVLRSQLKLPEDTALVVQWVDEQGCAKGVLRPHDVLTRLDDQLLVNGEQFSTLVRLHKPGDAVRVSLIREAVPQVVTVKLAEKESRGPLLCRLDPGAQIDLDGPRRPVARSERNPRHPGVTQFGHRRLLVSRHAAGAAGATSGAADHSTRGAGRPTRRDGGAGRRQRVGPVQAEHGCRSRCPPRTTAPPFSAGSRWT